MWWDFVLSFILEVTLVINDLYTKKGTVCFVPHCRPSSLKCIIFGGQYKASLYYTHIYIQFMYTFPFLFMFLCIFWRHLNVVFVQSDDCQFFSKKNYETKKVKTYKNKIEGRMCEPVHKLWPMVTNILETEETGNADGEVVNWSPVCIMMALTSLNTKRSLEISVIINIQTHSVTESVLCEP